MRLRQLEELLGIVAWGNWARWNVEQETGLRRPGWASLYLAGYRLSERDPLMLTDDEAEEMEHILRLAPKRAVAVAVEIHVKRHPIRRTARDLHISNRQVNNEREALAAHVARAKKIAIGK